MVALGIDLGTTNSCMAVVRNNKVEILENNLGKRTTPSIVAFLKDNVVVGEPAKSESVKYAESVIYDVKRIIGLNVNDNSVKDMTRRMPYQIVTQTNKAKIAIKDQNGTVFYTPEEISAQVLKYMKDCAEKRLDTKIVEAVITVPTYFNDSQRQATIDAGKIAGFNSIRLLNEPTAAAVQYGIENNISDGRILLVFDFGGGTFDVSVIKYDKHVFEVLAIDGDTKLGGSDVDNILMEYIKEEAKVTSLTKRESIRLKRLAENAKIDLSMKTQTSIEVMFKGVEADLTLTLSKFNSLTNNITDKTMKIVRGCLERENMQGIKIDDVLLVGGSSRIANISQLLEEKFGKPSKQNVNPDEAVAAGAAIWAARLFDQQFKQLDVVNICPYSLGVKTVNGKMSTLIQRHSKIPATATKRYKTANTNQKSIRIEIYSGENENVCNNNFLGEFTISNIASGAAGNIVRETFTVDNDGILKVSAVDESGRSEELRLNLDTGNLTDLDIRQFRRKLNDEM